MLKGKDDVWKQNQTLLVKFLWSYIRSCVPELFCIWNCGYFLLGENFWFISGIMHHVWTVNDEGLDRLWTVASRGWAPCWRWLPPSRISSRNRTRDEARNAVQGALFGDGGALINSESVCVGVTLTSASHRRWASLWCLSSWMSQGGWPGLHLSLALPLFLCFPPPACGEMPFGLGTQKILQVASHISRKKTYLSQEIKLLSRG